MRFSAFIVDDESMARGNLVHALQKHDRWTDLKTFSSGKNLLADVVRHKPQVVFLDIQMPGEDGISIAHKLIELRSPPLLVFVTAHSEHAVAAFELYALDYLLKPFDDERLARCVARLEHALDNQPAYQSSQSAQAAWAGAEQLDRLIIKSNSSVRIIDVRQIQWLTANGNYVDIHHSEGKHMLRASLKHVLSCLSPAEFIQTHRSHAVRCDLIREVRSEDSDRSIVTLAGGNRIPVGKSFRQTLLDRICP